MDFSFPFCLTEILKRYLIISTFISLWRVASSLLCVRTLRLVRHSLLAEYLCDAPRPAVLLPWNMADWTRWAQLFIQAKTCHSWVPWEGADLEFSFPVLILKLGSPVFLSILGALNILLIIPFCSCYPEMVQLMALFYYVMLSPYHLEWFWRQFGVVPRALDWKLGDSGSSFGLPFN